MAGGPIVLVGDGRLVTATRNLMHRPGVNMQAITRATKIPATWLWRFKDGRFADPSANRVELLYTYLTGEALELEGLD